MYFKFSNCPIGAKDPSKAADAIVRCCPILYRQIAVSAIGFSSIQKKTPSKPEALKSQGYADSSASIKNISEP